MLLLTRKIDESVMIGENISVKVIAMNEHKVLLGFSAPKKIPVHREEIFRRIQEENHFNRKLNNVVNSSIFPISGEK